MRISLVIFIVIHVLALAYFLEVIRRLRNRAKEYPLNESKETIPFGFIRLRHTVSLYVLIYIIWFVCSCLFYFKWFDYPISANLDLQNETFLNL